MSRFTLFRGLKLINQFINNYQASTSYVIIFKIYRELNNPKKADEFSELGHTLAVAFNAANGNNYITDPQTRYSEIMQYRQTDDESTNELYYKIVNHYGPDWKFID